jgi:CcmD family protein
MPTNLYIAYGITWAILGGYALSLWKRFSNVKKEARKDAHKV